MTHHTLTEVLGYRYPEPGRARRSLIGALATKPMAWLNSKIAHHLDRWVLTATGGRSTATAALTGLPVLFVTTTGVKTGQARTVPLLGIPFQETLALIGTGFGQRATPGWVHNLRANGSLTIEYRQRRIAAGARPARADEAEEIWSRATVIYPGYASYPVWARHREISVFVLETEHPGRRRVTDEPEKGWSFQPPLPRVRPGDSCRGGLRRDIRQRSADEIED